MGLELELEIRRQMGASVVADGGKIYGSKWIGRLGFVSEARNRTGTLQLNGGSRGLLITEFEMECANIECYSLHEIGIPIDRREVVRFGSHTGHLCCTDIGIILCLNRRF